MSPRRMMQWTVLLFMLLAPAPVALAEVASLPPVEVADGLPSHERCLEAMELANANYRSVLARHGMTGEESWGQCSAADNAFTACVVWENATQATDPRASEVNRRHALRRLIHEAGWRAVLTGELPPPIPLSQEK